MNIGEKIKKLRAEKMMTQAELSGDQVTRNMLSLIEKGKAVPSLQTLIYLASRLKVSPAYLLAEENEEHMLSKYSHVSDIRLAYKNKNYRICMDLCKRFGRGKDDEIRLLMAESALGLAKEELFSDRVRSAWNLLDEAALYASESSYYTEHVKAMAGAMLLYLGQLSPSLMAENIDVDEFDIEKARSFCLDDEFLRYLVAIYTGAPELEFENEAYELHVKCKRLMKEGDYEKAYSALIDIVKFDFILPGVILFHVFSDLEECCRSLGNQKNAKKYSLEKVMQLERILS